MPYASNADLNADVKKAHPQPHVQSIFRAAFNAAHSSGKYSESEAFRIAHAAADHAEGKRPVYFRPKTAKKTGPASRAANQSAKHTAKKAPSKPAK